MNRVEVTKFLTAASGYDNRKVDDIMVAAWLAIPVVASADYAEAVAVLQDHVSGPAHRDYFTVGVLAEGLRHVQRTTSGDLEADVRSAKARGLIEQEWPKREPLPPSVAYKLSMARQRDRDEAARYLELES